MLRRSSTTIKQRPVGRVGADQRARSVAETDAHTEPCARAARPVAQSARASRQPAALVTRRRSAACLPGRTAARSMPAGRAGRDGRFMSERERTRSRCHRLLGGERRPWRPCAYWAPHSGAAPMPRRRRSHGGRGARRGAARPAGATGSRSPGGADALPRLAVGFHSSGRLLVRLHPSDCHWLAPPLRASALAEQVPVADPSARPERPPQGPSQLRLF